ncbi:benzylsuccinate synthase gamma subunit family protein [Azoarcus sp. DN11]|uniref:benzylsuccinate synthase gamma subunit family protein n=1 Tax=Azoarcus sp. DN11 TaxID=356837 RepID=UPI000EB31520|nr:benzylsuccinate synthase gamma subunit family protein [Azoarcus sp. DN11]AYH43238.1 benzylsuccinate synthase subunit gamma [Azoarcus sp. DN11]
METTTCKQCANFFPVPHGADDYEAGKADCVRQKEDEKGKYWLSKPIFENSTQCEAFCAKR